jgi:hypothetical protein
MAQQQHCSKCDSYHWDGDNHKCLRWAVWESLLDWEAEPSTDDAWITHARDAESAAERFANECTDEPTDSYDLVILQLDKPDAKPVSVHVYGEWAWNACQPQEL